MTTLWFFFFSSLCSWSRTHAQHMARNSHMLHTTPLLAEISHGCPKIPHTHCCTTSAVSAPCATQQLHNREPTTARQPHDAMQVTLLHTATDRLMLLPEPELCTLPKGMKLETSHLTRPHHTALLKQDVSITSGRLASRASKRLCTSA